MAAGLRMTKTNPYPIVLCAWVCFSRLFALHIFRLCFSLWLFSLLNENTWYCLCVCGIFPSNFLFCFPCFRQFSQWKMFFNSNCCVMHAKIAACYTHSLPPLSQSLGLNWSFFREHAPTIYPSIRDWHIETEIIPILFSLSLSLN